MKKNILKKFIVLLSLGFVLLGFNFVSAEEITGEVIVPLPLECVAPKILNEAGDACIDVVVESEPLICTEPQILNETGNECIDPAPEVITCTDPQVLVDGICTNPVVEEEPTPDPVPAPTYKDVVVKDNCIVVDTDGMSHVFPIENGESKFLGVCALVAAQEAGYINSFDLVNDPSMGLYLKNINDTVLGSSEYWALWLNGGFASCGVGCLPVVVDDKLDLILTDWMASTESTKILFRISSLESTPVTPPTESSGGGGSSTPVVEKTFSVSKALEFLTLNQKSDGSFGSSMYTDWVAIASKAGGNANLTSSLINYLKLNPIDTGVITDYERRAMALMALGINPYDGTDINYIKKIIDSFDGIQFGDTSLVNDDIFALIVLKNAGYSLGDEIINKDINYILSKQSGGSWGSIDMTGAGIQALRGLENVSGVGEAISNGESYLISNQKSDSGFENSFSTSWALQSLFTNSNILKAESYLATKQQIDGGLENTTDDIDSRIWATAYAISAILHKPWNVILDNFSKQAVVTPPTSSSSEQEEVKKDIVISQVLATETKVEKVIPLVENKKVTKILAKTNIIKNIKVEKNITEEIKENIEEGNPLSASVLGSTESNNNFFSIIHKLIAKIKAPFIWLFVQLGF
jgi:hypothetical protein